MSASAKFYQDLGLNLIVDSIPRYCRFEFPDPKTGEPATLSLHTVDQNWTPNDWPLIYFEVDDLDVYLKELAPKNITPLSPAKMEVWLWREADILDPAGNKVRLYQAGENRRFPAWRIDQDHP